MKHTTKTTFRWMALAAALVLTTLASRWPPPGPGDCECAPLGGEYCGSDGVTYDSPCMAGCFGATVVHIGPC